MNRTLQLSNSRALSTVWKTEIAPSQRKEEKKKTIEMKKKAINLLSPLGRVQFTHAIRNKLNFIETWTEQTRYQHSDISESSIKPMVLHHFGTTRQTSGPAFSTRNQLTTSKRAVIKLGSAVITREDGCGLALGRLASIVEQVAEQQLVGRDCMIVSSGAVAFGKQRLHEELLMSMSVRQTVAPKENGQNNNLRTKLDPRAAAAVGQSGLMSLYDAMFAQYGIKTAQVLVTAQDFQDENTRNVLADTIEELIALRIVPVINTNDAVSPPARSSETTASGRLISVEDNDSLAARLATLVDADLLVLMTDVNGIYSRPPNEQGARIIYTFSTESQDKVKLGEKSSVGTGGMGSKVKSARWAVQRGVSVVICNGMVSDTIKQVFSGRKVGTFFTDVKNDCMTVEQQNTIVRNGSKQLQLLSSGDRAEIVSTLADLLLEREQDIIDASLRDEQQAQKLGMPDAMVNRLRVTHAKLHALVSGLQQIASTSHDILGRELKAMQMANNMVLKQVTVPIGVLLIIFESRPDCLPQIAALSIVTGNGLMAKGGKEAARTNTLMFELVKKALSTKGVGDAVAMLNSRDDVTDLLELQSGIDLIIPRGSNELVRSIQHQAGHVPVLGHAEGVCHVYIDKEADLNAALRIVRDSKCDYPAACNAMETLLIHEDLYKSTSFFHDVCNMLKEQGVSIFSGPRLASELTFGPPRAATLQHEYSSLACTLELVPSLDAAIDHISKHGSSHTDVIVTENDSVADMFMRRIDSACVFKNASTRFADGYRFGLGAEVGISTGKIHARGPVGVEGLLSTKWLLYGTGNTVLEFHKGENKFTHQNIIGNNTVHIPVLEEVQKTAEGN